MDKTGNYQLCLWDAEDRILMGDFNEDNKTLDAALHAEKEARENAVAALNAAVAKCGNCQLWTTTYTGNGKAGSVSNSLTFPKVPVLAFVIAPNGTYMPILHGPECLLATVYGRTAPAQNIPTWNGSTVTWFNNSSYVDCQLNMADTVYTVIALLAADQ